MNFVVYLLLTVVGFIFAIFLVGMIIKWKLSKTIGVDNFNSMMNAIKSTKDIELEEYSREKDVSGITRLIEPSIMRDFPDFHKELLFEKAENNLRLIFESIGSKDLTSINKNDDLVLLRDSIKHYVKEMDESKRNISFSEIVFHNHAIKAYEKHDGIATITTSSTLEYFYKDTFNKKNYQELKKQTRYTCKFIYVFDETRISGDKEALVVHCPNCGAPLRGLGDIKCQYCSADVQPINLKSWKMSDYHEDY